MKAPCFSYRFEANLDRVDILYLVYGLDDETKIGSPQTVDPAGGVPLCLPDCDPTFSACDHATSHVHTAGCKDCHASPHPNPTAQSLSPKP